MKYLKFLLPAALLALLLTIGCGGGGTGGSGGGGGGGGGGGTDLGSAAPLAGNYVEFVGGRADSVYDPLNMKVGDSYQIKAVKYDAAGNRTVLTASNFGLIGANGSQISISNSGVITVLAAAPGIFSVSCSASGSGVDTTLSQDCHVATESTTITGVVQGDSSKVGIKYIQINAYNSLGQMIAGATTGDNGVFKMFVPSNVTGISVKASTINTTKFYRSIYYNKKYYSTDGVNCPIVLGAITPGAANPLPNVVFIPETSGGPPPPPAGCF